MSELTREEKQALIRAALDARTRAVAPYSRFTVGAALRSADGQVFTGCNIENAAFTPTSCAERTALFTAVSQGVTRFTDIAVVGAKMGEVNELVTAPCGRLPAGAVRVLRAVFERHHGQDPRRFHRADAGRVIAVWLRPRQH